MIEFSKQISEKWNIAAALAEQLCIAYEKGDSPYFLSEYNPEVNLELTTSLIWEVFDFLRTMEELSSKKKRVINALKKADRLTPSVERHVTLTTNSFELDDLLLPLRPNPRSKGQIAAKKGLDELADLVIQQQEEQKSIEELASEYTGKDPSLKSADSVIQGVKDILAERFAYDETVRAMAREFAYDDGFFEIVPKNKKDPAFSQYSNKLVPIQELSKEELLRIMTAEDEKAVRLKLGVQLFRITELLRHHFITNPDSTGFDLICEAIDDSWIRLLQPMVERDVKARLREEAQAWAAKIAIADLEKSYSEELQRGPVLLANAAHSKNILVLAISGQGELLGATTERKPPEGKVFSSDRLRQFLNRHKPLTVVVLENDQAAVAEAVLKHATANFDPSPEFVTISSEIAQPDPSQSEWMQREFSLLLDEDMRKLYGIGLQYLRPVSLISKIGVDYYTVHPLQKLLPAQNLIEYITRIATLNGLQQGILIKDIGESSLKNIPVVTTEIIQAIKTSDTQNQIASKNDLLQVPGMTEVVFRNISGFIIVNNAPEVLDRTLIHPDFFSWLEDVSEQLNISFETMVSDPEIVRSYTTDDVVRKIYIEKKLIAHLAVGKKYLAIAAPKVKRKQKLNEVKEGAIVSGRVTNITPFGVFVNINAVCDGLIHISQLADEYVETPDQVVAVGDKVDVKILKVDIKKRRISLSMKNLGPQGPKVRPSKGQLDNLADHFKNR